MARPTAPEHVDVLIVGAGLSGVAAACHLQQRLPHKTYAILEAREAIGGTWDLFRYPGVRSDSDMFTLGYSFRPWPGAQQLADGPSILAYVRETAREHGVERHVRYGHRAVRAAWSSDDARWTVEAEHAGAIVRLTCSFLFGCTGYYRYDRGHQPAFAGLARYGGRVVHPQQWPQDLDHTGRRVVVIGSGATAVTLVPAMAERAAHVTMLQRSPTYVVALPGEDPLAARALRTLPGRVAHPLLRWKNVLLTMLSFQLSRRRPQLAKRLFLQWATARLPAGYDVATHFTPDYDPWDQRLCVVPDGDLFTAIAEDRASVVTDEVETFTERGIRLGSGAELEADVVVIATGLEMLPLGGLDLTVDGEAIDLPATVAYKGTMLSGVPNLALALGYTNASWTLKCELICRYVCRLLAHMETHGYASATPTLPAADLPTRPFIDLTSGYVRRAIERFPRQGTRRPWRAYQNYVLDLGLMRYGPVGDGLTFRRAHGSMAYGDGAMADRTAIHPAPGVSIPLAEVVLRASRSSGPGGQHANVTASRVDASFDVAASGSLSEAQKRRVVARHGPVVHAMAQDARSQARNRELALERLEARLAAALRVRRPRTATRPTRGSKERRLAAKRRQGDRKAQRRRPDAD